jgi:hypothetical protein
MTRKELRELDEYLMRQVGRKSSNLIGYYSHLTKDVVMKAENRHMIMVKKDTEVKIIAVWCHGFQPLGYSTNLVVEILKSPIAVGKLEVKMETLVEAMANSMTEEDMYRLNEEMRQSIDSDRRKKEALNVRPFVHVQPARYRRI